MALKLDLTCIKIKWYTKFQLNISKHVGEKCGKLWRTDGRTETRTDGHHHTIIRPVWRRAYKNIAIFASKKQQEGQHIGATYKSILKVLLKQYRSPTDPNKFKSATIISVDHFQITMRHDLDRWPFDPKINRAHPWLMGSKCMKFHDHRLITESVIVRKPFSNNHAPWPWPLTFWPQNQ